MGRCAGCKEAAAQPSGPDERPDPVRQIKRAADYRAAGQACRIERGKEKKRPSGRQDDAVDATQGYEQCLGPSVAGPVELCIDPGVEPSA